MRIQEEYIVPGLGVVILLSVIGFMTSGASIVHLALLTLLGSAAVGTYFLPHAVQIELRVVIAALGLLILLLYFSNLAFWLALLAFGAIGALQIRHSDALQMFPQHTIAWVKGKLGQEVAMGTGASEAGAGDGAGQATQTGEPSEAGEAAGTPAAQGLTAMPGGLNIFQGGVKPRIGRIAASAMGVVILLCVFTMPWVALFISVEYAGESQSEAESYTYLQASGEIEEELDDGSPRVIFIVLVLVTLVSMASVVLPRVAVIITSIAGMAVTLISYINIFGAFARLTEDVSSAPGVTIFTVPNIGLFLAGGLFLAMIVLMLIPALNRPEAKGAASS